MLQLYDYILISSVFGGFLIGFYLARQRLITPLQFFGSIFVLVQSGVALMQLYYSAEVRASLGGGYAIFPPNNPYIGWYSDIGQVILVSTLALFFGFLVQKAYTTFTQEVERIRIERS